MCSLLATPARVDRRLERLPQQYKPRVPRESQADPWGWASLFADLGRRAHWHRDQHGFYRAFEWNLSRTTGQFDAQISSRGSSPQSPGDGHVFGWMLL